MIYPCKDLVAETKKMIKEDASHLTPSPILGIIQVGDDPASNAYIKGKKKDCEECGFGCIHIKISEDNSCSGCHHDHE